MLALLVVGLERIEGQIQPTTPQVAHPAWVKIFAEGTKDKLLQPTCLAFDQKGRLWVSDWGGVIVRMEDNNRDGVVDKPIYQFPVSALAIPSIVSMLFIGSDLWVSYLGAIGVFQDTNRDGDPEPNLLIAFSGIPQNMHEVNQLTLGPDGWIYVSVGSLHNTDPGLPSHATIWRFDPAASNPQSTLQIYATGVRNSYEVVFDDKGNLFATDNGRDDMGALLPHEELNHIVQNGFYGFPNEGAGTIPPIATFSAHSSPGGMLFYQHDRFPGYTGNLLVVLYRAFAAFASQNDPSLTRKIVRVELTPSGSTFTTKLHDVATHFGLGDPPLDLTTNADGEIFVCTYNAAYLPDARIMKISHPYLKQEGTPQTGGKITLRTWAKAGWGAFLFFGRPLAAPIPTVFGDLHMDPLGFWPAGMGVSGADDQFVQDLTIPADPHLVGARIAFQSIVGPLSDLNKLVFTNKREIQIQ